MLRQIGYQTTVLLHPLDHGLPGSTTQFPAVQEDDGGRPGRAGFPHKQIHGSDRIVLVMDKPHRMLDVWVIE
jgi:hypothetical protein